MEVQPTAIPDVLLIEPTVHEDERGFFLESYHKRRFLERLGIEAEFVQDSHARSTRNVLRGLHYQVVRPQGKLVRVVVGEVFDVSVDLRKGSPTFGKWVGSKLSAENMRICWIPPGFAHGFLVVSAFAEFLYKTTEYRVPEYERCLAWNDSALAIGWPLTGVPILSPRDRMGQRFVDAEVYD